MENINLKADLDISKVLTNIQNMENTIYTAISNINQTFTTINVSVKGMATELTNSASAMSNDLSKISTSGSMADITLQSMNENVSNLSKYKDSIIEFGNTFSESANFINDYTAKIIEANTGSEILNGGVSSLGSVVQAMTSNLDLASVSTSLFDMAIKGIENPVGLAIELFGKLIIGLGTVSLLTDENYLITEKHKKMVEENAAAVKQEVDAYNEKQGQIAKQTDADLSMINNSKRLYDQLLTIVYANGQVKSGYEGTASFILGELNNAMGTHFEIIDGVIQGYDGLAGTVNNSVGKMRVDAILKGQRKAYDEAVQGIDKSSTIVKNLENELVEVQKENATVLESLRIEEGIARAKQDEGEIASIEKKRKAANLAVEHQKKLIEEEKGLLKEKLDDFALYEENAAAAAEGRYEDVKTKSQNAIAGNTENQLEAYKSRYDQLNVQRDVFLADGDEVRAEQWRKEMDEEVNSGIALLEEKGIQNEQELATIDEFMLQKLERNALLAQTEEGARSEEYLANQEQIEKLLALKTGYDENILLNTDELNSALAGKTAEEKASTLASLEDQYNSGIERYQGYIDDKTSRAEILKEELAKGYDADKQAELDSLQQQQAEGLTNYGSYVNAKLGKVQYLREHMNDKNSGITEDMVVEAEHQAELALTEYGKVADNVTSSWDKLEPETKTAFENMMKPMMTEMDSKKESLWNKAKSIADGIIGNLKKAFDINSPSKKVKAIFHSVMEGAEIGLDDKTPKLLDQTEEIAMNVIRKFSSINDQDVMGMMQKMKSAVMQEQHQMASVVDASIRHEVSMPNKILVELPEVKGIIRGNIENHILMDGRETAIQLTPFISEELAFSGM